jgi:hypothetical protein
MLLLTVAFVLVFLNLLIPRFLILCSLLFLPVIGIAAQTLFGIDIQQQSTPITGLN